MNAEELFIEDLITEVTSKLTGTNNLHERLVLPNYPQKMLILGSLSEEDSKNTEGDSASVKSNSLTLMFLSSDEINLKVRPKLNLYYGIAGTNEELKVFDSKDKKKIPYVWKRIEAQFPIMELGENQKSISLNFDEHIKQIEKDGEHKEFYESRPPKYAWSGEVCIEIEKYNDQKLVKVRLINHTKPNTGVPYETAFFNCGLEIDLGEVNVSNFIDRKKNDFGTVKEIKSKFKTFNCDFDYNSERNIVKTLQFKRVNQKRLVPKDKFELDGKSYELSFNDLSESLDILDKLNQRLKEYLEIYQKNPNYEKDNDFKKITQRYEKVINRFGEGMISLKNNENAKQAFNLMNLAFYKYSQKTGYPGWRIFQIVFIVSLVPDIIMLDHPRRNEVDLLHVNTGGGKSEAYFGLVVFSAFFDRLNGKKFGTTAISKFPLRMLSVDQLQRIASIFIIAEEVRKEKINKSGDYPFSVAYFVGSSEEFPRKTATVINQLKINERKNEKTPGKIITSCPLCNGQVNLIYDSTFKVLHRCETCQKDYYLFFTDEEIYRYLPTFIISTVDKLAGISLQRRFRNILGGKLSLCKKDHGFLPRGDTCEVEIENECCKDTGENIDVSFQTAPSIIIQDEMHLIREGFGTIDSHFETFIESLNENFNGFKFKNITMTATIKGAEEQNKAIYWKSPTNIFPGYSPIEKGIDDPFYTLFEEKQRVILGLKPNFRDNQYATLLTLRYIAEFISKIEKDKKQYAEKYNFGLEELENLLGKYKCLMTYHNKKADVNAMNVYMYSVVNSKLSDYNYLIKHDILTGENTLEEIKEQINTIKNFDGKQNKLLALSCTSIVSHGVDIPRWNMMCFQGVPGSTAEYIQALSRVGRRDIGIVFLWFYPNRVRDISIYDKFQEYNQDIDLFVEKIPVERWTKLGFHQTFHSLFCGAILNYTSNKLNIPIYNLQQIVDNFFSRDLAKNNQNEQELIDFLKKSYHVSEGMPNSNFMIEEIAKGVSERLKWMNEFSKNPANDEKIFFPNALNKNDKKYWKVQFGMRGIQDTVVLKTYDRFFVERYKK